MYQNLGCLYLDTYSFQPAKDNHPRQELHLNKEISCELKEEK